ncbi:hypothetical protein [Caviibacterium pharyngocola]|uniref:Uncharacterized protein n=1 Tax=Caviibacterium pharyngocola TaxID=28159 RepID=A0A2M8RUL5_9PAST|nr:hypothetical protein [Caviibacterium pharyngocola]PJG82592.1 hypothetical protein CVP04_08610 [Caviibacterium pharyngocola]
MEYLSITRSILQPRTWENSYLMLRKPEFEGDENGSIIYSLPLDFSGYVEVYFWRGVFEWRIVDINKVIIDSFNAQYGSPEIALTDALLFCKQKEFI